MKFKSTQHFFAVFAAAILFISFSSEHPTGRTGAPGDGLCSDCHGGSGGGIDGDVTLTGVPSDATPGQVYSLTVDVDVSAGSPMEAGFQILALRDANDTQAGVWTNNDGNSSFRTGSGGRIYFGHQPSQDFGGGTNVSWEADWEAPAITDDITFYMVANLANGNGSSSGDKIVVNTFTTSVEVIDPIEITFTNIVGLTCNSSDDGSAEAIVAGGTAPYSYEWDNGDDSEIAMNLSGGSHFVTVTDDMDVMSIAEVSIPEPVEIEIDPEVIQISCFGEEDGEVALNPSGGTGSLSCDWGDVGEGCDQDFLEAGEYFVTVVDENNCSVVFEIEIEEPEELNVDLNATDATSAGNDGEANARGVGGTRPYTFRWSNGVTETGNNSSIDGLMQGDYTVEVEDANGCEVSGTVTVGGVDCNLVVTSDITDVACHGELTGEIRLNVSGNSSIPTFQWSNGASTPSLTGVGAGMYSVTVTENANCLEIITGLSISEPDSLQTAILLLANPSCSNAINGRITLGIAGGTPGYDLLWSNGAANDTIIMGLDTLINIPDTLTQLVVGTYAYTLTDNNGCTVIDSIMLNNSDLLPPVIMLQQGTVILDDQGGAEFAEFSLVDAGTFDNCELGEIIFETGIFSCDDIGINSYNVTVFDTNGNSSTAIASIVVEEQTPPVIDCSNSTIEVNTCGEVNYTIPTATDNCDVPILNLLSGLPSGSIFPVGVTSITYNAVDECGNESECSFSVTVVNDLTATFNVVNAACAGGGGSITPNSISGGSAPYMVEPSSLVDLSAGDYNINITDSNGCVYMATVTVGQENSNLTSTATSIDVLCFGSNEGSVLLEVNGGSGDYSFEYEGGVDPMSLSAGIYSVLITDNADGCQTTQMFEITEPQELELMIGLVEYDLCTGEVLTAQTEAIGGVEPYEFDGETTDSSVILSVVDANGCITFQTVAQNLILDVLAISDVIVTDSDATINGALDITVSGGSMPYTYEWMDGTGTLIGTTEDLAGLAPGDYELVITDAMGCIKIETFTVDMISATVDLDRANAKVKLFPNPSSDFVTLEFIGSLPSALTIINAQGKIVQELDNVNDSQKLDVSTLSSGIYLTRIQYEELVVVKTFFKM